MSTAWLIAYVLLAVVVLLLGTIVLGTLRRITAVLERAELAIASSGSGSGPGGLEAGAVVPTFETGAGGFTASDLDDRRSVMLFLDRDCPPCKKLLGELDGIDAIAPDVELIAVFGARAAAAGELPPVAAADRVIVDSEGAAAKAFATSGTPHAFALAGRTVVATGTPNTLAALRELALRLGEEVIPEEIEPEAVEA